ncbi:glycosyltransferase family 2 protein [Algoriphagus lacus]|uniref:glycosyltransferase family 2 protein n=1 Tax=Algoriphagus lacus TaxID=2056311 RepID=UPI0021D2C0EE|nr:glycosyltransferase family 2 protein [Algoriphagus lacus]
MDNSITQLPKNHLPKVIGFVPAFNSEKFILRTLEALANQTYQNFEIWICDDASTDATSRICRNYCEEDPRFKFFHNEQNQGWWNTSLRFWSTCAELSDYCFFHPHDDIPDPDFIFDQVNLLEQNPDATLCVPGIRNTHFDGRSSETIHSELGVSSRLSKRIVPLVKWEMTDWWAAYHGIHRSKFIPKVLPVKPLRFGEKEFALDLIWLIKMASQGPFVCADRILFEKNYSQKTLSGQWKYNFINRSAVYLAMAEEVIKMSLPISEKSAILNAIVQKAAASIGNKIKLSK